MYLAFIDPQLNSAITPLVKDEYRTDQSVLTSLTLPAFNNAIPEDQYQLFSNGKSQLLPAIAAQFQAYLEYSFEKIENWNSMRDAFQQQRLAIMTHEDGEPECIWYCIPGETMETYIPPAQPIEVEPVTAGFPVNSEPFVTVAEQLDAMTLSQAIEFVKQKAQSFALATETQQQLQAHKKELAQLEERRAHLIQTIAEFEQHEYPTQEEFDAITELAGTLKRLFN